MTLRLIILCTIIASFTPSRLTCGGNERRYEREIFSRVTMTSDVVYGASLREDGGVQRLTLDVYAPTGDSVDSRPLLIFIHGGGFKNNDKVGIFSSLMCEGMAKRGYVAASINYRLSRRLVTNDDYFTALYRAMQDGKAAVRFFRMHARDYGIDTSHIFVMGSSAGAKTALAMAYLDQKDVPSFIDTVSLGTVEGASGSPGYSSRVHGVVNCWGAMHDVSWIQPGGVPVYNVYGTADTVVPYDSSFSYHGMKYGGSIIAARARTLGITTGQRPFLNTGHTLDNNAVKQDSAFHDIGSWLLKVYNNK
jgi:poly(3-hydroxybutyrate) depolymerase